VALGLWPDRGADWTTDGGRCCCRCSTPVRAEAMPCRTRHRCTWKDVGQPDRPINRGTTGRVCDTRNREWKAVIYGTCSPDVAVGRHPFHFISRPRYPSDCRPVCYFIAAAIANCICRACTCSAPGPCCMRLEELCRSGEGERKMERGQ